MADDDAPPRYAPACVSGAECDDAGGTLGSAGHPVTLRKNADGTVVVTVIAWIPYPYIEHPIQKIVSAPFAPGLFLAGDGHSEADLGGSFRIRSQAVLSVQSGELVTAQHYAEETWHYVRGLDGVWAVSEKGFADLATMTASTATHPSVSGSAGVTLGAEVPPPEVPMASAVGAAVAWSIDVQFAVNNGEIVSSTVNGKHKQFPSYAVFVDDTLVYAYRVDQAGGSPMGVMSWMPMPSTFTQHKLVAADAAP
jgi:hypothetical protein